YRSGTRATRRRRRIRRRLRRRRRSRVLLGGTAARRDGERRYEDQSQNPPFRLPDRRLGGHRAQARQSSRTPPRGAIGVAAPKPAAGPRIAVGRSLPDVAAELGHGIDVLTSTYAHVIAEYRGRGPIDPDAEIRAAREPLSSTSLASPVCPTAHVDL